MKKAFLAPEIILCATFLRREKILCGLFGLMICLFSEHEMLLFGSFLSIEKPFKFVPLFLSMKKKLIVAQNETKLKRQVANFTMYIHAHQNGKIIYCEFQLLSQFFAEFALIS